MVDEEKLGPDVLVFWQGLGRLHVDESAHEVKCRVTVSGSADGDLEIEVDHQLGTVAFALIDHDHTWIEIPGVIEHIDVLVRHSSGNSEGRTTLTFGLRRSPVWVVKAQELRAGRTALINFGQYRLSTPTLRRFELKACGWRLDVIPVSEGTLGFSKAMRSEDYQVTHQVEFAREDGSVFTTQEAQSFLEDLSLYLSFCRGRWVGTSFTVAFNLDGEVGLEQWGSGRVSPWQAPDSWLDIHHGDPIVDLYRPFCEKLADQPWKEVVSWLVYWFTRAETETAGPDGSCILLQAALERFAWHLLVRERKAISEKGFKGLEAADQLRLMLNLLSVPATVPGGLPELLKLAKSKGLDGPGVFTFIRNRIVHPPKLTESSTGLPYYEAYCLAKWYLELAVLSSCGYVGKYSNRTLKQRWVGAVENVPWT